MNHPAKLGMMTLCYGVVASLAFPVNSKGLQSNPASASSPARICTDIPKTPCLDRPRTDAKVITGKAVPYAMIDVKVDGKKVGSATALSDGTFQVAVDPLKQGARVEANQTTPTAVLMGFITVGGDSVCGDGAKLPCLNQPVANAKSITGKA